MTLKQRIIRLLDNLDEDKPKDNATLKSILAAINRLIVGYEVFEYRMTKKVKDKPIQRG